MTMDSKDPRWKTSMLDLDDPQEMLTKFMAYAAAPEKELIPLFESLEKANPKACEYIDDAIDMFAKARASLMRARSYLEEGTRKTQTWKSSGALENERAASFKRQ